MPNNIQFWFDPTTGTALWFLLSAVCMVVIVVSVRILYLRMQRNRREKEFHDLLLKYGLWGKPEEDVVRLLAQRHRVDPPAGVLANLNTFDALAGEEILRAERENLPLSNRIDRIEYLYSIRMQAFGHDPSVGGLGVLIPDFDRVYAGMGSRESRESEGLAPSKSPGGDPEGESEEDSPNLDLRDESDEMAKLLGFGEPSASPGDESPE